MYLVITSVAHIFSILPIIKYYNIYTAGYINTIILSTISSILYHIYDESNRIINILDYLFALIWFLYDVYIGYTYTTILFNIILVNAISFTINMYTPYNKYYELNHSIWHILNACKCFYVSNCINIHITNMIRPTNI